MNYQTQNKVKDVSEFCKLYKINIPIDKEVEYYIQTLKKSDEYKYTLDSTIKSFSDLENWVLENGYPNVRAYKDECIDALTNYIENHCQAYKNMLSCELPKLNMFDRNRMGQIDDNTYLISLDFVSANFNVLRTFEDAKNPELTTWVDLCDMFNVHPALSKSKSFRQIVFGKTNPKRFQTFQHNNILSVMSNLKNNFGYKDEDFVFISHDELILKAKHPSDAYRLSDNTGILMISANGMPIRVTLFSLKKVKKNTFVKTVYGFKALDVSKADLGDYHSGFSYNKAYDTLHGVPGNKFYMYFKKYIIKEELDARDLMYYNDGELCQWIDEDHQNLSFNYNITNHTLSEKEAKTEYSYVWNQLSETMPNMSSQDKIRVIEIVAGACKHCFQDASGCQCWNDD